VFVDDVDAIKRGLIDKPVGIAALGDGAGIHGTIRRTITLIIDLKHRQPRDGFGPCQPQ
jgi:hypothetical protein